MTNEQLQCIRAAQDKLAALLEGEFARIERMKDDEKIIDYASFNQIVIGVIPGDGIGPLVMRQALRVLDALVHDEIQRGRIALRMIEGMDIERRAALNQSLPDDVLAACKACSVLLKGPLTTPRPGDPWPNMPSANSLLRRELNLYAAVRPVRIPERNIDWCFFRENIEGEYIWGSKGIQVNEDLAIDFKVQTRGGSERIARAAFDYARKNGKRNVTAVTKANIVKLTDGNFLQTVRRVGAQEYPDIQVQERLVDAMVAKMLDPEFAAGCEVFVLPNLYGDIVTDVAAEHQGGLGSASSSNIGNRYALFEAIHGTAPFLISHNRAQYADPSSLIRAVGMLLAHIGYGDRREKLERAMEICTRTERKLVVTTDADGATTEAFTDYILDTLAAR